MRYKVYLDYYLGKKYFFSLLKINYYFKNRFKVKTQL
jgi:hypothetical protein